MFPKCLISLTYGSCCPFKIIGKMISVLSLLNILHLVFDFSTFYNWISTKPSQIVVKSYESKNIFFFCKANLAIAHRYVHTASPKPGHILYII